MAQQEKDPTGAPAIKPATIRDVARHPVTYAMIVIATAFASVLTAFIITNSTSRKDEAEATKQCRLELDAERQAKNNLINAVLLKQGVIDKLPEAVDSLTK